MEPIPTGRLIDRWSRFRRNQGSIPSAASFRIASLNWNRQPVRQDHPSPHWPAAALSLCGTEYIYISAIHPTCICMHACMRAAAFLSRLSCRCFLNQQAAAQPSWPYQIWGGVASRCDATSRRRRVAVIFPSVPRKLFHQWAKKLASNARLEQKDAPVTQHSCYLPVWCCMQGHLKKVRYYLIFSLLCFFSKFFLIHDANIRHKHGGLNVWIERFVSPISALIVLAWKRKHQRRERERES